MLAALRARYRHIPLRVVLDAGAANNHRELLQVVDQNPNQVVLARTPRRTAYLKHWKALPEELFTAYEEPGRYKGARPKRIHVAETTIALRADRRSAARQVRTIVAREEGRRGKDRWHALFVFRDNATPALTLIEEFRTRQHHEQTYRVLLHDAFVDAAPSGYSKQSTNPDRPGFRKNALMLYSWLAGLAVNALSHFTASLPERFHRAQPRTLRLWWFHFPAQTCPTRPSLSSCTPSGSAIGGSSRSSTSTPKSSACPGWATASCSTPWRLLLPSERNPHSIPPRPCSAFGAVISIR